jgi:hypothetical protein
LKIGLSLPLKKLGDKIDLRFKEIDVRFIQQTDKINQLVTSQHLGDKLAELRVDYNTKILEIGKKNNL